MTSTYCAWSRSAAGLLFGTVFATGCANSTWNGGDSSRAETSVDAPQPDDTFVPVDRLDVPIVPVCTLQRTDGPVAVNRHANQGTYRSQTVVWNSSLQLFEATGNFISEQTGVLSQLELVRFRVDATGHISIPSAPTTPIAVSVRSESRVVRIGSRAAVCTDSSVSSTLRFGTTPAVVDIVQLRAVLPGASSCESLAAAGDNWMIGFQQSSGSLGLTPWIAMFDPNGTQTVMNYQIPNTGPNTKLGLIGIGQGFAGSYVDTMGNLVFGWTQTAGPGRGISVRAMGALPAVAPAMAAWPGDGVHFSVVPSSSGMHRLYVVDSMSFAPPTPVAVGGFSMSGSTTPALVPTANGLVVAIANWGDLDPNNGFLQLHLVTPDMVSHTSMDMVTMNHVPASMGLVDSDRLSGDTDGRNIVILWSGRALQGQGERATYAAVYRCM